MYYISKLYIHTHCQIAIKKISLQNSSENRTKPNNNTNYANMF